MSYVILKFKVYVYLMYINVYTCTSNFMYVYTKIHSRGLNLT